MPRPRHYPMTRPRQRALGRTPCRADAIADDCYIVDLGDIDRDRRRIERSKDGRRHCRYDAGNIGIGE